MPVQVMLGGTEIHIKELVDLNVGDVIRLDRRVQEDLLVCVNGRPKFYCRPGTVRKNLAVYVTDDVQDEEAIEGFGFDGK
jgi:flagellar motor switch protein FliM